MYQYPFLFKHSVAQQFPHFQSNFTFLDLCFHIGRATLLSDYFEVKPPKITVIIYTLTVIHIWNWNLWLTLKLSEMSNCVFLEISKYLHDPSGETSHAVFLSALIDQPSNQLSSQTASPALISCHRFQNKGTIDLRVGVRWIYL